MSTDRETTLAVRSWLEDGVNRLPDRILDAVLDQVPTTPQRRSGWSAWRSFRMNTYAKLAAGAAAVLVLAIVGYQFLPRSGGPGGQPTSAPSPSPSLLAKGDFTTIGATVRLDATGAGDKVSGTMSVQRNEGNFTVALQCARAASSGLLWIAGDVTTSTDSTNAAVGTRAGIVIQRGSAVKAIFIFQMSDPRSASCQAFFDTIVVAEGGDPDFTPLAPIVGTVQLAP